jgi:hypothetical protein
MRMEFEGVAFQGPILVTASYFLLWYFFLVGIQRRTKYRLQKEYAARGEVFDRYFSRDEQMLAADRVVINTQEQMVPFLAALWLHAAFVSSYYASLIGFLYVALRAIYPVLLGKRLSKMNPRQVHYVTVPCYVMVFYLFGAVVWRALAGV